ncbi:hypothetical protein F66182_9077 [Fusarium sp. NRRL 66182]|nr:hypothetical protein F66182_9077 [Fusarium sp. NRRL 66182]
MTSLPPSSCCYQGFRHEGTSVGRIESFDEFDAYISEPKESTKKAILFLPDVVGHTFINAQLIADQFAENGYFVLIPDLFHGDSVPLNEPEGFDIMAWLRGDYNGNKYEHTPALIDPIVEKSISILRSKYGIERIGSVGYCFGSKYTVRFLDDTKINVGFIAHPSFIQKEELEAIKAPLSIAAAETDFLFPPDKRKESEEILGKIDIPSQINFYLGTSHGFAVRCDLSVRRQKLAKEVAFAQAVTWFNTHL